MSYTLSDIVPKVQTRVRDPAYSASDIKAFINDAQNAVFNEYDLRFMEKTQTYTLVANVQDITNGAGLPTDFVSPLSLQITTTSAETDLPYKSYKELDTLYPNQANQAATRPQCWYFYGSTINVDPKPDQGYALRLRYLKKPVALSADSDVPEIPSEFAELLVYGAGYRVFEEKDMDSKAGLFQQKYEMEVAKLVAKYAFRQKGQVMRMKLGNRPLVNTNNPWG